MGYGGAISGSVWTVVTLKLYVFITEQVALSATSIRRVLLTLDFRWRRPVLPLTRKLQKR